MVIVQLPGAARETEVSSTTTPLVVLFERDDAIAVPLLSQLRLASYDVRSARTAVELFDILGKHLVALVLVDLGIATAGRREFWVALDAQRKGRAIQVMTFRFIHPTDWYDNDFDAAPRALADVEVHGAHEFPLLIEGVRQRIPLTGGGAGFGMSGPFALGVSAPGLSPAGGVFPGGIAPIGAALGIPSPFMQNPPGAMPMFAGAVPNAAYDPYAAAGVAPQAPSVRPMPPVYPYAQQPGFNPAPAQAWPFPPPAPAAGMPPAGASDSNSPFAHPIGTNPFAQEAEQSPFAQPYSANPFADAVRDDDAPPAPANPDSDPFDMRNGPSRGPSAISPMPASNAGSSDPWWASFMGGPAASGSGGDYAASFAVAEPAAHLFRGLNGFNPRNAAISDVWTPPDEDFDQQTGVVPEMSFQPAPPAPAPSAARSAPALSHQDDGEDRDTGDGGMPQQETAPIPVVSQLPMIHRATPTETALGNVLVEGALLTPQRLEALRGIQQMLASVGMSFKLGELALLFKFLSPDQLLAALLVSRGLVSPGQIAGLGRVKQELSATGMDYDLENLLVMFHILPTEQLRQLRAELAGQQ